MMAASHQHPLQRRRGQQQGGSCQKGSLLIVIAAVVALLAVSYIGLLVTIDQVPDDIDVHGGETKHIKHMRKKRHPQWQEASGTPRLPDILLIGAQKSGSSALANWLFDYGICPARVFGQEPKFYRKEVHYFGNEERYSKGVEFYTKRFADCPHDALAMDATPATMLYADQVRKTYDEWEGGSMVDKVKIVAVLREPSARELSWYNHVTLKCRTDRRGYNHADCFNSDGSIRSFSEYVHDVTLQHVDTESTKRKKLCRGHYAHLLKEWFTEFHRDQILILSYDEILNDETQMMQRVQSFLVLDPQNNPGHMEEKNTKNNEHKIRSIDCGIQQELNDVFDPLNDDLYRLLDANPGPKMEQRPFPRFVARNCTSNISIR